MRRKRRSIAKTNVLVTAGLDKRKGLGDIEWLYERRLGGRIHIYRSERVFSDRLCDGK